MIYKFKPGDRAVLRMYNGTYSRVTVITEFDTPGTCTVLFEFSGYKGRVHITDLVPLSEVIAKRLRGEPKSIRLTSKSADEAILRNESARTKFENASKEVDQFLNEKIIKDLFRD